VEPQCAAQSLPDLTGKSLEEAEGTLAASGFVAIANRGAYRRWQHTDGSIVHMSDVGRIVREGPQVIPVQGRAYRRRYASTGRQIIYDPSIRHDPTKPNTHDTGEVVQL
jgi:predicted RNA binding protein YcfA (HicA-like mRNA interferase family)